MSHHPVEIPIKRPLKVRMVLDNAITREGFWPAPLHTLGLVYPGRAADTARAVLADMTAVFDRLGVAHYICDGTLLGFIREGDFIDGDNDIDVRFDRRADSDGLIAAFEVAGFNLTRRHWTNGQPTNLAVHKQGIDVDLMGSDFVSGHALFHITKYPRCCLSYCMPFDGVERRDFDGLSLWVPRTPERELVACYGPNWRTPTSNWHHHFSHQALFQCSGRLWDLLRCAFNLQEGQRCLNGGNPDDRPSTLAELAGVARSMAGIRLQSPERRLI